MNGIILLPETFQQIMHVVNSYNSTLPTPPVPGVISDDMRERDLVWVTNNTGSTITSGTPVKLLEPDDVFDNWETQFSFYAEEATENSEIAGVTIDDIPDQSAGLAKVNGLCIVSGVAISDTTHTHVTINSSGDLETAAGGPLVILGTLTAIDTFYSSANADVICNLSSRGGGGGISIGTFNADMLTSDATGDLNFDAVNNPDNFGGLNGKDVDCDNILDLSATSGDTAVVWTNDAGDVRRILTVKGAANRSYSNKVIGTLNSDITALGGSVTISPTYADHPDLSAPYSSLTVNNDCKKVASSGAVVVVIANHDLSRNTIVEVEC